MDESTKLLTEAQAARYLALSVFTLRNWRCRGDGPPFVKISRNAVRYRTQDLDVWVSGRVRSNTSASGRNRV